MCFRLRGEAKQISSRMESAWLQPGPAASGRREEAGVVAYALRYGGHCRKGEAAWKVSGI